MDRAMIEQLLQEATREHLEKIGTETSATTITDYYDAITTHLGSTAQHRSSVDRLSEVTSLFEIQSFTGVAMCVPYKCQVVCSNEARSEVQAAVDEVFERTEYTFSPFREGSELWRFNASPVDEWVELSKQMYDVLRVCDSVHSATGGLFDPTSCRLLREWHRLLEERGAVPDDSELAHIALGWDHLEFDWGRSRVRKRSDVEIDLCSVSKGWAVDALRDRLSEWGPCLCDWGGDVRANGVPPTRSGSGWVAALVRPPKLRDVFSAWKDQGGCRLELKHQYLRVIELDGGVAAATTGDYSQIGKFGYYHLLDTRRRRPLQTSNVRLCSVTPVCSTCVCADVLATALLLCGDVAKAQRVAEVLRSSFGLREVYYYVRNHETFTVVGSDGTVHEDKVGGGHGSSRSATVLNPAAAPTQTHPLSAPAAAALRSVPKRVCIVSLQTAVVPPAVVTSLQVSERRLGRRCLVSFSVEAGTALAAAFSGSGCSFAAHLLTGSDSHLAVARAAADGGSAFLSGLRRSADGVIAGLQDCANVCVVSAAREVGDHVFVTAAVSAAPAAAAVQEDAPLMLWRGRLLTTEAAASPASSPSRSPRGGYSSPRRILVPGCYQPPDAAHAACTAALAAVVCGMRYDPTPGPRGGFCVTPAIAIGSTRSDGPVGVPVLDPRLCSVRPPVMSFCVNDTDTARNVLLTGGELAITFLSDSGINLFHRRKVFDQARPFAFLPVPSFRPIPSAVGRVHVRVFARFGADGAELPDAPSGSMICLAEVTAVDPVFSGKDDVCCPVYTAPVNLCELTEVGVWRE